MPGVAPPPCDQGILRGAPNTPGCASHAQRWVLGITILGSSTAFVEGSAINVALPAIQQGVGASLEEMQWIASVYTLFLAALTLAAGSAGDRWGRRPVFALGVGILAAASTFAGFVGSGTQLIVARALQGLGAALLVPNSLALLSAAFPKAERGRAIGTWSAASSLTGVAGPLVGGVLVDAVSWRAAFFVVIPLTLVTLIGAVARMPDVRVGGRRARIDWWGLVLGTAGLGATVFGLFSFAPLALAGGLGLLVAFAWHEAHTPAPMVPPRLFRSRTFLGTNVLTLLLYLALSSVFFVLPFDLVRVQGYSAAATGGAFLPFALAVGFLSRFAGGVADRLGPRIPMVVGPLVAAAGFLLTAAAAVGGSYWTTLFPAMLVIGLGMAITVAPLTSAVMGAVDEKDVGVASGVNNTVARVSGLLAVAIAGLVVRGTFAGRLAAELDAEAISPGVRAAVLAQQSGLGDVAIPAAATASERAAVVRASERTFVAAFRRVCVLSFLLAVLGALAAALTLRAPSELRVAAAETAVDCGHLGLVLDVPPRSPRCEECARLGHRWVHLRACLSCGYVGCCDSSRNRHATAHFFATAHPIVRSLEPGETWRWCYVDETAI